MPSPLIEANPTCGPNETQFGEGHRVTSSAGLHSDVADRQPSRSGGLRKAAFSMGRPIESPTCNGTNRRGDPCGRPPIPGGTVCRFHGGAAHQVREKAIERLQHARDLSLERYIEFVTDDGDLADPRILLDGIVRLTDKVELMQGRATQRSEVDERVHYEEVRVQLIDRLETLLGRHTANLPRGDEADNPGPGGVRDRYGRVIAVESSEVGDDESPTRS